LLWLAFADLVELVAEEIEVVAQLSVLNVFDGVRLGLELEGVVGVETLRAEGGAPENQCGK
jgi:hypothetical protein